MAQKTLPITLDMMCKTANDRGEIYEQLNK